MDFIFRRFNQSMLFISSNLYIAYPVQNVSMFIHSFDERFTFEVFFLTLIGKWFVGQNYSSPMYILGALVRWSRAMITNCEIYMRLFNAFQVFVIYVK